MAQGNYEQYDAHEQEPSAETRELLVFQALYLSMLSEHAIERTLSNFSDHGGINLYSHREPDNIAASYYRLTLCTPPNGTIAEPLINCIYSFDGNIELKIASSAQNDDALANMEQILAELMQDVSSLSDEEQTILQKLGLLLESQARGKGASTEEASDMMTDVANLISRHSEYMVARKFSGSTDDVVASVNSKVLVRQLGDLTEQVVHRFINVSSEDYSGKQQTIFNDGEGVFYIYNQVGDECSEPEAMTETQLQQANHFLSQMIEENLNKFNLDQIDLLAHFIHQALDHAAPQSAYRSRLLELLETMEDEVQPRIADLLHVIPRPNKTSFDNINHAKHQFEEVDEYVDPNWVNFHVPYALDLNDNDYIALNPAKLVPAYFLNVTTAPFDRTVFKRPVWGGIYYRVLSHNGNGRAFLLYFPYSSESVGSLGSFN